VFLVTVRLYNTGPPEWCNLWPRRQPPYLHKPAIAIVTSFLLWRLELMALAAPIPIMMSFSLWHHLLLSWPHPPLWT